MVVARLAACVSMLPVRSVYTWKGQTSDETEVLLLVKTRSDMYDALEAYVRAHHTYENPEILAIPLERASTDYLAWLDSAIGI
jgi:periplasmic divalent cation tolerance protein